LAPGSGIADDPALLRRAGADQVSDDHKSAGNAEPYIQWLWRRELADRVDDREPGARRPLGIVLICLGMT
jgi:hypothetical protein